MEDTAEFGEDSLYESLNYHYIKTENYEGKHFLSISAAQEVLTLERTLEWAKKHPLHRSNEQIDDRSLIENNLEISRLLLASLILGKKQVLFYTLTQHGLKDDNLFDGIAFSQGCSHLKYNGNEYQQVLSCREKVGAILDPGKHQNFAENVTLPYQSRGLEKQGGYSIVRRIRVCEGHLRVNHQGDIAMKIIRLSSHEEEDQWPRLNREMVTLRAMQHEQHIVSLLASYHYESRDYSGFHTKCLVLLFPWVEQNLLEWMRMRTAPDNLISSSERRRFICDSIYGLISGLSVLHGAHDSEHGFYTSHHDIKPSNILVSSHEMLIADFGYSNLVYASEDSETNDEPRRIGSHEYNPPEYWNSHGDWDPRKHGRSFDIWSMGCVFLELLTLMVHGWASNKVQEFKFKRESNTKKSIRHVFDDNSFSKNWNITEGWIQSLRNDSRDDTMAIKIIDVVRRMLDREPKHRPYAWEVKLDLYMICHPEKGVEDFEEHMRRIIQPATMTLRGGRQTPMHRAAMKEDINRIKILLEKGWSMQTHDQNGNSVLDILKQSKNPAINTLAQMEWQETSAMTTGKNVYDFANITKEEDLLEVASVLSVDIPPSLTFSGSTASTSAVVKGAAEDFAELLLKDHGVRNLLASSLEQFGNERSRRNFFRLLKLYAIRLRAEMSTPSEKAAVQLVASRANHIAYLVHRELGAVNNNFPILSSSTSLVDRDIATERYLEGQQKQAPIYSTMPAQNIENEIYRSDSGESNEFNDPDEPDKPLLPNLEAVRRFMVESNAFADFKYELARFVFPPSTSPKPMDDQKLPRKDTSYGPSAWLAICRLSTLLRRVARPRIRSGYKRVEWVCTCGKPMYRDFEESVNIGHVYPWSSPAGMHQAGTPTSNTTSPTPRECEEGRTTSAATTTSAGPVSSNTGPTALDHGTRLRNAPQRPRVETRRFFEVCINTGKYITSLGEIDITQVTSDGDLFAKIVKIYYGLRKPWIKRIFKKPVQVHYVLFTLEKTYRVGIRETPLALPPKSELDNKRYEYTCHRPPPMDHREFLHYFYTHSSGHPESTYFNRLPKKLGLPLNSTRLQGPIDGWGIHIIEGPNKALLGWCIVAVLISSFFVSVVYSVAMKTQEQGFGIGSWMVAVLTVSLAALYFHWEEE